LPNTKITMTLLVYNEEDIIEQNIRFHRAQGVNNFIVMDNRSTDATSEILQRLSQHIEIEYILQPFDDFNQSQWVTEMARRAANVHNADWVINNDADEFWLPQSGTLKRLLETVPSDVSVLCVTRHNAVVIGEDGAALTGRSHPEISEFFETNSRNCLGSPLLSKVLHRASPSVTIAQGNHAIEGISGAIEVAGDRLRILHYPYRSLAKYKDKIRAGGAAYARNTSLSQHIGQTWRTHFAELNTGGVDQFWGDVTETMPEVIDGLHSGRFIKENAIVDFLNELKSTSRRSKLKEAIADLISNTSVLVENFISVKSKQLDSCSHQERIDTPMHYNMPFILQGARAHLQDIEDQTACFDPEALCSTLPKLRDTFSLFPRNTHFRTFLGDLLKIMHGPDAEQLRKDCEGKRVILFTSCHHRLTDVEECLASFECLSKDDYHPIVLLGAVDYCTENETGLSFAYDGHIIRVPVPDSYEHLHRKLFYAFMLFDLLTKPQMLIKLDDDILLDNTSKFVNCMDFALKENAACAGRVVGTKRHDMQAHGWHIGKCADPVIETRGYQYPLPKRYAAGGYGYVLSPEGLSACSYMYLAMKEFFQQRAIGLEDVCTGHAIYAVDSNVLQLADPNNILCLPGLTTKAHRRFDD